MKESIEKISKTLRGKITFWYATSVGIIIIIFVMVTGVLFRFILQDQIDHHIHIAVNEAHEIVQGFQEEKQEVLLKNLISAKGMTIIVLSPDGAPVLETNSPDVALITEHQLQKILAKASLDSDTPVHFTEGAVRFAALPVKINEGKGIVAVGYSTQVIYSAFIKMIIAVAGLAVLLIFPIGLAGYLFLKRQLKPLEIISYHAKNITKTSDLSHRIKFDTTTEELIDIKAAFNIMLSRLEDVFKKERDFFSDAAHTLKTPLSILRSEVETSTWSEKNKKKLITAIDTANDTIKDLLFLSKLENTPLTLQNVSLSTLLQDIAELTETLGKQKNIKVITRIQKNIYMQADPKLLQKGIANIAYNAVLYNKRKGTITIKLKRTSKVISITISDTGIGIAKSDKRKIFTRFFRGENVTGKGSGLGLAISKAVIEQLGGSIHIKSKINKGTSVLIIFPC